MTNDRWIINISIYINVDANTLIFSLILIINFYFT